MKVDNKELGDPQLINRIEFNLNCASTCLVQPDLEYNRVYKWLFPLTPDEKGQVDRMMNRTCRIVERAIETGDTIFVDAEQTFVQKFIDVIAEQLQYLYNYKVAQRPVVINTIQVGLTAELLDSECRHGPARNQQNLFFQGRVPVGA